MPNRFSVVDWKDTVIVDEASAAITYVGRAKPGSSTSDKVWQILRVNTSGTITTTAFAGGSAEYDKAWDNRTSFTYS